MAVQFNNATFSGPLASVGVATPALAAVGLGAATAPLYTGASATGAAGLTSVTIDGTVTTPGSTVTASVSVPSVNGSAAVNLSKVTANYLGYTTSSTGNVEYYFDYTPAGAVTPIGFAVSGAALGTQTGTSINDTAGTSAPSDPNFPTSAVGPILKAAVVNGATVTLTYDDMLGGSAPQAGAFTVTSNGTVLPVTGATTAGNTVTLTLGTPATASQPVTVGYAKLAATAGTPGAVQDLLGNDAATLSTALTATNNTTAAATGGTTGTTTGTTGSTTGTVTGTVGSTTGTTGSTTGTVTGTVGSTTGTVTGTVGSTTGTGTGVTTGSGGTTVTTPVGTVTTGSGGTTVTTPVGTVTVPVGATTDPSGTTVTTPVGTVTTGSGGTTVTTPVGTVTVPVGVTTGAGGTTITTPVGTVTVPVGVGTGSGGTTITTPVGSVTVPTGGVITLPGASGGSTTIAPSSGGASTMTSVSPSGATTTQTIPSGSTIAAGTGQAAGDVVSINPYASYGGNGEFTIGGQVAASSGVKTVTISAVVDGAATATVLGTATVAADGSYSFLDKVGAHLQGFITATETDSLGATTSVQSPYSLQAGLHQGAFKGEQDLYTPDGSNYVSTTMYKEDGSRKVDINLAGQTFQSNAFDTFNNGGAPENTFVFNPGHGLDVVNLFRANGSDHDTLSFQGSDFNNDIATVLQNTKTVKGGVLITDPATQDTVKLTGVTKKELTANTSDFSFHA